MTTYALYETESGRVLQTITQPSGVPDVPGGMGACAYIEVAADFRDQDSYIADGRVVGIPLRPSDHHLFDWTTKQWFDPRTLQDLKDAKWAEIKAARSSAEYGGFTWDGSAFDSDAISQARIQGAVQLAGMAPEFSIDWTLANNEVRTLSAADMLAVGAALGLHVATQFNRARVLREQIEVATTADAVAAIVW